MNKTININLGGTFFHIDEEAYDKLQHYLVVLKKSFYETQGGHEIISDIEHRIAELLNERLKSDRQVINSQNIKEVITIMGQPEELIEEDQNQYTEQTQERQEQQSSGQQQETSSEEKGEKELFRDIDTAMLGGVLGGLAHYIGMEKTWLRIIWLLLSVFTWGGFILIYLVLWIIVPEATTRAQKLKMEGKRVTISNIEKSIKKEFNNFEKEVGKISDKIKDTDFSEMGSNLKKNAQRSGSKIQSILSRAFRLLFKIIGIVILIKTTIFAIALFISWFFVGILGIGRPHVFQQLAINNDTGVPIWALVTLLFLISIIPVVLFMFLGTKLTFPKSKRNYLSLSLGMAGLWIVLILISGALASKQVLSFSVVGNHSETVSLQPTESLFISLNPKDSYQGFMDKDLFFDEVILDNGKAFYFDRDVEIELLSSGAESNYMKIKKSAKGENFNQAKARAKQIIYEFQNDSNSIALDPFFLVNQYDKMKEQRIRVELYLKNGLHLEFDPKLKHRLNSDFANDQNMDVSKLYQHKWRINNKTLECLDCGALKK